MKIELQPRDDHQVKVIAEFEPEIVNQYKERSIRKISKQAKVPGFRPGKIPPSMIIRIYGEEAIEKEAIDLLIDGEYGTVLKESKIDPGAPGSLEEIISTDPLKLAFVIPLAPVVELGDYHNVRQDYLLEPVAEKEIENFIHRMQAAYATAEPVERPAQKGDLIYFRISGKNPKAKEGEMSEVLPPTNQQVVIGETTLGDNDWPFKGFGENLIGTVSGAIINLRHKHTKSADELEKMRGLEIEYQVEVQSIKSLNLPPLDEDFAKTAGNYASLDEFKNAVRTSLENSAKKRYEDQYFDTLITKLREISTVKYPPQVLEDEKTHVLDHLKEDLSEQKMDLETYLKTINKEMDAFIKEEVEPTARKRLEQSLILDKIAEVEKLEVGKEELSKAFVETYQELSVSTDLRKLERQMSRDRLSRAIASQAASRLLSDHVLNRLKEIATGKFKPETSSEKSIANKPKAKKASTAKKETSELPTNKKTPQKKSTAVKKKTVSKKE